MYSQEGDKANKSVKEILLSVEMLLPQAWGTVIRRNISHCWAQLVKNPPAMQENLVRFLGQEDLLEKG